jgi:hypothetical protein
MGACPLPRTALTVIRWPARSKLADQSEPGRYRQAVGLQKDPGADIPWCGGALEQAHGRTRARQQERGRHPTDARADDYLFDLRDAHRDPRGGEPFGFAPR